MSVTDLRLNTNSWSVWFRGNCVGRQSNAVGLYDEETAEWLKETADELLNVLREE